MKMKSGTLKSDKDGFEFYYFEATPTGPKRIIVLQHGFGEHSGRYQNLLEVCEKKQTAVYALDARGHGKTPGKRGHVDDFNLYAEDLRTLVKHARKKNPKLPIFILGHSMGGLVSALAALNPDVAEEISGLLISSGAFRPVVDLTQTIKKNAATFLSKFLPATTVDAGLDVRLISRDDNAVMMYKNDPLVHGKISFKMGADFFAIGESLIEQANRFQMPLYLFHGDADGIADFEGTKAFFEKAGSKDKTLKIYPGFYHETINEPLQDRQHVLKELMDWIKKHS